MSYWFAVIPVGLWLVWFGWHVLRAPYEIYKEQFEKHEAEIQEKESAIKKLIADVELLPSPALEIEGIPTETTSAKWHPCLVVVHNKSSTKTADNVRVELISLDDELTLAQQTAYFHPPFPLVLNPESSGTNAVNSGGKMQYRLFNVSANDKSAILGAICAIASILIFFLLTTLLKGIRIE